jgi:predicted secreted protein
VTGRATLLALVVTAGCSLWSSSPEAKPAAMVVAPGERFTIVLDANRSTGFRWEIARPFDAAVVALVDTTYQEEPNAAPGQGGKEVWTFDAVAPGWTKIQLAYRRPWEDLAPARTVAYSVDVRG